MNKKQFEIIYKILEKYPSVKKVKIFGSRAKGNYTHLSDLDLVIIGGGQDKISSILQDIAESDFLYSVDILGYDDVLNNALLRFEIDTFSQDFFQQ
jgi:uncharacterized protein